MSAPRVVRGLFGWTLTEPADSQYELPPELEREALVQSLTGPYVGPNLRAIAEIIADRLIAIRDEGESDV